MQLAQFNIPLIIVFLICSAFLGCWQDQITKHNGLYVDDFSPSIIVWVINGTELTVYHERVGYDIRKCHQEEYGVKITIGNKTTFFYADGQGNLKPKTLGASMQKLTDNGELTPKEVQNMIRGLRQLDTLHGTAP